MESNIQQKKRRKWKIVFSYDVCFAIAISKNCLILQYFGKWNWKTKKITKKSLCQIEVKRAMFENNFKNMKTNWKKMISHFLS